MAGAFRAPLPSGLSLAVFRIALGLIVVIDALQRLPTAGLFLADDGFFPSTLQDADRPSLFNLLPGVEGAVCLLVAYGAAGAALLVGFRSRFAALVAWMLILSLHHRNPFVTNGGDFLLRLALLWACFLPLGNAVSIDRLRNRPGLVEMPAGAWTVYRLQVVLVYVITAGHKLASPDWLDGSAFRHALALVEYQKPAAEWLLELAGTTAWQGVIVVTCQLLAPLALLARNSLVRMTGVAVLAGMQISMFLLFHLGFFPWISLAVLIPFLPLPESRKGMPIAICRDWRTVVCGTLAAVTFSYAALSLVRPESDSLDERVLQFLGLNQRWPMFSDPARESGRVAVIGRSGGERTDLIAEEWFGNGRIAGAPFAFADGSHRLYKDARWTSFLVALADARFPGGRRSQRLVAERVGGWFASRHPELEEWRVIVFRGTKGGLVTTSAIGSSER